MGDYNRHHPTSRQLEGVQYLLAYGLAQHFIAPEYKLIAHNQVVKSILITHSTDESEKEQNRQQ